MFVTKTDRDTIAEKERQAVEAAAEAEQQKKRAAARVVRTGCTAACPSTFCEIHASTGALSQVAMRPWQAQHAPCETSCV